MPSSDSPTGNEIPGTPARLPAARSRSESFVASRGGRSSVSDGATVTRDADRITSTEANTSSKARSAAGHRHPHGLQVVGRGRVEAGAERLELALVGHREARVPKEVPELEPALHLDEQLERLDQRDVAPEADVDERGPEAPDLLDRGRERASQRRSRLVQLVARPGDPKPRQRRVDVRRVSGRKAGPAIVAEDRGAVVGRPRQGPHLVERPGQRHRAVPRHQPEGRAQAGHAGEPGRPQDRAAGLRPERERHQPSATAIPEPLDDPPE